MGFATDKGKPVLLPPGMHQWKSATLKYEKMVDLNESVIRLGPITLLTVDEGEPGTTHITFPSVCGRSFAQLLPAIATAPRELVTVACGPLHIMYASDACMRHACVAGYAAVTQNNGRQCILPGGSVHLLTHRNWQFEKFVSVSAAPTVATTILQVPSTVATTIQWCWQRRMGRGST